MISKNRISATMIKKTVIAFFVVVLLVILIPASIVLAAVGGVSASDSSGMGDKNYIQSVYGLMNPLESIHITNDWQQFSAIGEYEKHPAVDIACSTGDPLAAAGEGTVIQSGYGWDPYGAMTVQFRLEKNPMIVILYAHVSKVHVKAGDRIEKGQVIAACGNTGISTGSHLHLQVNKSGKPVDPNIYFKLK